MNNWKHLIAGEKEPAPVLTFSLGRDRAGDVVLRGEQNGVTVDILSVRGPGSIFAGTICRSLIPGDVGLWGLKLNDKGLVEISH